jgi:hypothetical protein
MFIPGYKCKNKKLYSLCIVEYEEDNKKCENVKEEANSETIIPLISPQYFGRYNEVPYFEGHW